MRPFSATRSGSNGQPISGDRIYYLTDADNNVTAITDSSGNVIERYVYDAYGTLTIYDPTWTNTLSGSSVNNTILFGGMSLDPTTGLYYDHARWYDASMGTFISRDPLGLSAGANMYQYCGGNATGQIDPSGMDGVYSPGPARTLGSFGNIG